MKCYVRCRACHARRVLKKHPLLYLRLPLCKSCGTNYKGYLVVKPTITVTCYCNGYHFPHRYLSPRCNDRVVAEIEAKENNLGN